MSRQSNSTDSSDIRIDRRAFVRWTGGGLLVGAAGAQVLIEACSSPALVVSSIKEAERR